MKPIFLLFVIVFTVFISIEHQNEHFDQHSDCGQCYILSSTLPGYIPFSVAISLSAPSYDFEYDGKIYSLVFFSKQKTSYSISAQGPPYNS